MELPSRPIEKLMTNSLFINFKTREFYTPNKYYFSSISFPKNLLFGFYIWFSLKKKTEKVCDDTSCLLTV